MRRPTLLFAKIVALSSYVINNLKLGRQYHKTRDLSHSSNVVQKAVSFGKTRGRQRKKSNLRWRIGRVIGILQKPAGFKWEQCKKLHNRTQAGFLEFANRQFCPSQLRTNAWSLSASLKFYLEFYSFRVFSGYHLLQQIITPQIRTPNPASNKRGIK